MKAEKLENCSFRIRSLYILIHVRAGSFCPKLVRLTNEYLIHRRNQRSQKKAKRGLLQGRSKVIVYKSCDDQSQNFTFWLIKYEFIFKKIILFYVSGFCLLQNWFRKRKICLFFLFARFCFLETANCRTLLKRLWAEVRMNKGLIRNLWHHLPAPHSQKNRAQPNSVSRFCQNYFCSTLETSSGGSKAKTVNDHGWLSFTRFDLTPCTQIIQQ